MKRYPLSRRQELEELVDRLCDAAEKDAHRVLHRIAQLAVEITLSEGDPTTYSESPDILDEY